MRPGRMKHKARSRHRRAAVTCAGVSALTVIGGSAAFATDGPASLVNGGNATTNLDQHQDALTAQLALANTGGNEAHGITANLNLGSQNCTTDVTGGAVDHADHNK